MPDFFKSLFQQADIGHSRSSVLNPIQWATAILGAILVVLIIIKAPPHYAQVVIYLLIACVVVFLICFVAFSVKDPDALRSEHYSLSKMAIEKGLVGDNLVGLFDPASAAERKQLSAFSEEKVKAEKE